MVKINTRQRALLFGAAFFLWLVLFRDAVLGNIPLNGDTNSNYLILKYFFNSVLNDTIPLWDPYTYLGRHFLYAMSSCALNPFAWSIPVLHLFGMDFYQAYICFIVGYYFLGCLGFYFLVKETIKDESAALLGFGMFLFSGMGAMLFVQVLIVYMFVPAVWFFVFLIRFFRSFKPQNFLFCTFAAMILCVSCFPFYFLTLFLVFNLFFVLIYPDHWLYCFHGLREFVVKNRRVVLLGICAVLIAAGPMIIFKIMDSRGDMVYPGRHRCSDADAQECMNGNLKYSDIAYFGSLGERMPPFASIFRHLDKFDYNADDFFYIPVLCYFLILLAFLTRFDRLRLLVLAVGATVFLISLGVASPVHLFLFERIFYFELFRNLYFFIAFLIPMIVFFAAAQYKALADARKNMSAGWSVFILAGMTAVMLLILIYQGEVLPVSYVSVAAAVVLALAVIRGYLIRDSAVFVVLLLVAMIVEPWHVFTSYQSHVPASDVVFPKESNKAVFSFTRPSNNELPLNFTLYRSEVYSNLRYPAYMKDSNGIFLFFPDTLMRSVNAISRRIPVQIRAAYVRNKILAYDHVQPMTEQGEFSDFGKALWSSANTAFVSDMDGVLKALEGSGDVALHPFIAEGRSQVEAVGFSPNHLSLKTHFDRDKLLVYNDAYSSDWKVFVDGRQVRLYRANMAFKGVFVFQGQHTVDFRYEPPGGVWVYWLLMVAMMAVPIAGLCLVVKNKVEFPYES